MKTPLLVTACLLITTSSLAAPAPAEPGRAWTGAHTTVVALMKQRKNDEVVKAADALIAKNAKDYEAHYLRGRALFQLKQDVGAIESLTKAIQLKPDYPNPYFFRALTHAYSKKAKAAAKDFEKATELAPKETAYWVELARNYARMGNAAGAASAMEKAVALTPKAPQSWYLLGNYRARADAAVKAREAWEKTVALAPKHTDARFNLGQYHQTAGSPEKAAVHFAAILETKPDEADALKKMVQVHYQQGQYKAAQPFRARYLEARKKSPRPDIRGAREFCFDLFQLGKDDVFAYETIEKKGDLYYHYTFRLIRNGKAVKSVNLESSAHAREKGIAFILGLTEGKTHSTFDRAYEKMPAYDALKKDVIAAFQGKLEVVGSSGPKK